MHREEEVDTAIDRRYPKRQIQKTKTYEPTFQGKRYKDDDGAIILNCKDTLVSTSTEEDEI